MLKQLFISKVRVKMLKQFLFNQNEEYHVRGLVRILDEEINAVRRELQNLEASELLISKKRGNKLFYFLNDKSPYLNILRDLFYIDRKDVTDIHKILSSDDRIQTAVITENYLKNGYQNDYDIDMLILTESNVNDIVGLLKSVEEKVGKELRITVLKPSDIEFHHKKRDDFLLNILRGDKIIIIGDQSNLI